MNITGLVKYIGKLGTGASSSSMFVGLKLDQPGENRCHCITGWASMASGPTSKSTWFWLGLPLYTSSNFIALSSCIIDILL